jgi:hypothetical protein
MTKRPDESWPRMAEAMADARHELREMLARIDAALMPGADPIPVLRALRMSAANAAGRLTAGLKAPVEPRNRPRAVSERFQPLWGVSEGQGGGRYQLPMKRRHVAM